MFKASVALALFLAFAVWHLLVKRLLEKRRVAAEARRLGCQAPPRLPHKLPLGIAELREMLQAGREQLVPEVLRQRFANVGAWTFSDSLFGMRGVYMTADPRNVQALLATQFADFEIGERRRGNFGPLLGDGIFLQDGRAWEHSRAMLRPQFARELVADLRLEEAHVQHLMLALPVRADTDANAGAGGGGWTDPTDLQVLFFRLTLDSATEFFFGRSVNSQLAELAAEKGLPAHIAANVAPRTQIEADFPRAFDLGQTWLAKRSRFAGLYWLVDSREFRKACRQTREFADQIVQQALAGELKKGGSNGNGNGNGNGNICGHVDVNVNGVEKDGSGGNGGAPQNQRYVFLDALIAETRDPDVLRAQLLNILLAGRDTTASHLGWLFFLLARHPAVFEKLRRTIIDTFGTYEQPRDITFARLKACEYLQWCNNETQRLYPVVPFNARQAVRDTTLPRGGGPDGAAPIYVPRGTVVGYSVHVMHHRTDLWGADADEFRPERWQGLKHTWNYLPFNGGPRICLGRKFFLPPFTFSFLLISFRVDSSLLLLLYYRV